MATGNVVQGIGGLDASIVYELSNGDNTGSAFNTTLSTFEGFYSPQTSYSDLIALGLRTAVRACGGPLIPLRLGRVDATKAGSSGVPQPQNDLGTFQNQFLRMGFNTSGMITLVACGHTFGAVHASNQPLVVAPGSAPPYDSMSMDSTPSTFDNRIATEYVSGNTTNPLVVGFSVAHKRNSDKVVFQSDQNATIQTLTDPNFFRNQCQTYMQQMIEVVPKTVTLSSSTLSPYECKPYGVRLYMLDGKTLAFSGDIRIRTTNRPASSISSVQLTFQDRNGGSACGSCVVPAQLAGSAAGLDDSFSFYSFSANISAISSISSFTVTISKTDGSTETLNNGGGGFPVQDILLLQSPQTCSKIAGVLQITAAVRNGTSGSPTANTITKNYTPGIIKPKLNTTSTLLTYSSTVGQYSLYNVSVYLNTSQITPGTRYNLTMNGQTFAVSYQDLTTIGTTCASPPTSQTPAWTPIGCYTDSVSSRTLNAAQNYDTKGMTTESCAAFCKSYKYFGTEYSQECYCANSLGPQSTVAANAGQSCNMACTGDSTETCGGSGYLNLYQNPLSNLPVSPTTVGSYNFVGCYTDSQTNRTLPDARHNDAGLTLESCAAFCASAGYPYMGTEYAGECYCAQKLASTGTNATIWDCNMGCSGNVTEACGAANRLSLYQLSNAVSNGTTQGMRKRGIAHQRHSHAHFHRHDMS